MSCITHAMRLAQEVSDIHGEVMLVMARLCYDIECEETPGLCDTCPLDYENKDARKAFMALLVSAKLCERGKLL